MIPEPRRRRGRIRIRMGKDINNKKKNGGWRAIDVRNREISNRSMVTTDDGH